MSVTVKSDPGKTHRSKTAPPGDVRRVSGGVLNPHQLLRSIPDALRKLDPRVQFRNPVMFVVEVAPC
jgi:potassium-transporting ATPase ATP-binding subunit